MSRRRWWRIGLASFCAIALLVTLFPAADAPSPQVELATTTPPSAPAATLDTTQLPAPQPTPRQQPQAVPGVRYDYIVQASSLELARGAVERVGGVVTGELEIIRAVGAALDDGELQALWDEPVEGLRVYDDASVRSSDAGARPETYYPTQVKASQLHQGGITGSGVTVAVLDTGLWARKGPLHSTSEGLHPRVIAQYDVVSARNQAASGGWPQPSNFTADIDDPHGHGTHVSSIIASSGVTGSGGYQGVAPGVELVSVRVLDSEGAGRYFDVIHGIQWVVTNRSRFGIRVLNLSLSAPPRSHYWDDPLNQAVMAAWASGIVVVAAAGNSGPEPMTIGVPGNVPYVITVGAVTDNHQPFQPQEYSLANFSSAGPTYEGFVKPEVVAMGGHMRAYATDDGTLAQRFPHWLDHRYSDLVISGTSQAAAVTSGIVALMLSVDPNLSPDDVKCRLMDSARPAVRPGDDKLAYSVFQQGAGLVNAYDAVYNTASGCANVGLNVALDLAGVVHYGGRANQDENGNFYIMEEQTSPPAPTGLLGGLLKSTKSLLKSTTSLLKSTTSTLLGDVPLLGDLLVGVASTLDGLFWDGSPPSSTGHVWSGGYNWVDGFVWSDGYTWSNRYAWSRGYTWSNGYTGEDAPSGVDPAPQE